MVCTPHGIQKLYKDGDEIKLIDLTGGPSICHNEDLETNNYTMHVNKIEYNESKGYFFLHTPR